MPKFKVNDRVRVIASGGGLFNYCNAGETGTVDSIRCSETVYVRFDDGALDYGLHEDLELVTPAGVQASAPQTVKDKLEQIEKLVAEIKEILY